MNILILQTISDVSNGVAFAGCMVLAISFVVIQASSHGPESDLSRKHFKRWVIFVILYLIILYPLRFLDLYLKTLS